MAADVLVALPLRNNNYGVMRAKPGATSPRATSPRANRARHSPSQSSTPARSILRSSRSSYSSRFKAKPSSKQASFSSSPRNTTAPKQKTGTNYRGSTGNSRRRKQLNDRRSKPPSRQSPAPPASARPSTPTRSMSPRQTTTKNRTANVLVRPSTPPSIDEQKVSTMGTATYRAPTELELGRDIGRAASARRDSTSSNYSYSADDRMTLSNTSPDELVWKTSALTNQLPKISNRPRIPTSPAKRKQTWPKLPTTRDMENRLGPINAEIERNLAYMRSIMDGRPHAGIEANPEDTRAFLKPLSTTSLLPDLLSHLGDITHKASQDLLILFDCLFQKIESSVFINYLKRNTSIFPNLVDALQYTGISSTAANILKSVVKVREVWNELMMRNIALVYKLFDIVQSPDFTTASGALTIVQLLLSHPMTKNEPPWAASWIIRHYETVMPIYHTKVIKGANYVSKRMGLKMLGEILTESANQELLMRYISERKNLILMMTLLRDRQNAVRYEAFHIFKLFVANPHKQEPIVKILMVNRKKLIRFLGSFLSKRDTKDEMFKIEKATLIDILESMQEQYAAKKHVPTPSTVFDLPKSVDLKYNDPIVICANRPMPSINVPSSGQVAKPEAIRRISESVYVDIHKRIMSVEFPEVPDMFNDVERL